MAVNAHFHRCRQAVLGPCRVQAENHLDALWRDHRLFALDGSSFSMPDTPELRAEFGYPPGQAPGCGFPTAHLLVAFDLHHGYLLRAVPAPCRTQDMAHAAVLHQDLRPGDVLLGDRAFCSSAPLALCRRRGIFGLFRAHQRQLISFVPGRRHVGPGKVKPQDKGLPRSRWLKRLGKHDQLVEYFKPKERPAWLTAADYAALPASLVVRAVRFQVRIPGYRTREVTLVTTRTDGKRYSARALARRYAKRWQVELDIRSLKTTLGLSDLRCLTPVMVEKELWLHCLAYHLVRRVAAPAALLAERSPRSISFKASKQALLASWEGLSFTEAAADYTRVALGLLQALAKEEVGDRPGRCEPRAIKRRPKPHQWLREARGTARARLLQRWRHLARRQSPVPVAQW